MTNYNSHLLKQYPPNVTSVKTLCKLLLKNLNAEKNERRHRFSKAFVIQSHLGSHLIDDHLMT